MLDYRRYLEKRAQRDLGNAQNEQARRKKVAEERTFQKNAVMRPLGG
jgi:hypothetical protein